jgi:alkylation response protein AidB-like acyl-CoA dehydrogenase
MDFDLSEEQQLLKDTVDRLMADRYDFDRRKEYAKSTEGFSLPLWRQYAELGLLGLPFGESHGGIGDDGIGTMIVMQAFGGALALEPYLATVVLCGGAIRHGGSAQQRDALLPKIADGTLRLAFAQAERQSRYNLADVKTTAKKAGAGWVLGGE